MARKRSLSEEQRQAAIGLFAAGYGRDAVATRLEVSRNAVRTLYDRWQIRGDGALEPTPPNRVIAFELKREIVQRVLAGETKLALAREYGLSSPQLVATWVRRYRADGEDGLRPKPTKPTGQPKRDPAAPVREESELERLRRENERLRAEVAYLGKLRALIAAERR